MPSVDEDVAALFALPPERFTAARDGLASSLRAAGDTDGAKAVKALRRPTLVAWAVDAAARARPDAVARLLEAGARLDEAQRQALAGRGGAAGLRATADERRDAVRALTEAAGEALEAAGKAPDAHRDAIASTFEAASVDAALGTRLRAATVEREARPPAGLGGFEGLTVVSGGAPPAGAEPNARTVRDPAALRKTLEAAVRAAALSAKTAAAKADGAEAVAARAAARATAARATADKAVAAAEAAEAESRRVRESAAIERRRASKAAEAATKALAALEDIEP